MFNLKKLLFPNIKEYSHIISLGYNCEVSYQFFLTYKFVESSLFAWCNVVNIDNLIFALKNMSSIATGKLENTNPMWHCCKTNIFFHGKAPASLWSNSPTIEDIENDKQELISRIRYLKEKFIHTANDAKENSLPNLYIFKYKVQPHSVESVYAKIMELYITLKTIVTNKFDLLIIFEDSQIIDKLKERNLPSNIFLRNVIFFTPEESVTQKYNDRKNWHRIFREFRPKFKHKKTKKFKFEEI